MQLLFKSENFITVQITFKIPSDNKDELGNSTCYKTVKYNFAFIRLSKPTNKSEYAQSDSGVQYTAYSKTELDPKLGVSSIGEGMFENRLTKFKLLAFQPPGSNKLISRSIGQSVILEIINHSTAH